MFDAETAAFLETGCALIVGTVGQEGEPYATRGWGLDVLPGDGRRLRLLLNIDDTTTVDHAASGGAIAITAASVRTLRSMQLKGRAVAIEVATTADAERARRYCEAFFADVIETDHTAPKLLERLVPYGYVASIVEVDELFDQTPGPTAGARIAQTDA